MTTDEQLLRVVVARRGAVKPSEFRLREGEIGLSLFRAEGSCHPADILEAVRAAGKRGELAVVEFPTRLLLELGLCIVATPGGTPDPVVNEIHVEARFTRRGRLWLWLRRRKPHDEFNERIVPALVAAAKLLD